MCQNLKLTEEAVVMTFSDAEFLGALLNKYMRETYTSPQLEKLRDRLWHMSREAVCEQAR